MHGLQDRMEFNHFLERQVTERLAEIEREDADRCANCGGEDCICCEYYQDRQKWVSPNELFGWNGNPYEYDEMKARYDCDFDSYEDYEEDEEWEE